MTKEIGKRFELSDDSFATLYYNGTATIGTDFGDIMLSAAEVTALRRAFIAQDAAESEKLPELEDMHGKWEK